jgi:hypothetical protein
LKPIQSAGLFANIFLSLQNGKKAMYLFWKEATNYTTWLVGDCLHRSNDDLEGAPWWRYLAVEMSL